MSNVSICVESLEDRRLLSAAAPMPTDGGRHLTESADQSFSAKLGEITEKVIDVSLFATIDWGDGTTSSGKLIGSYATGEYYVKGVHSYAATGDYAVSVKVFGRPIGSQVTPTSPLQQFTSVITATPPAPSANGETLSETVNQKFSAKLGEFTQKVIDLSLSALIDWGDGTHSHGTLVGSYATGEYYVKAAHTYSQTGTFKVHVKIFASPVGSPIHGDSPITKFSSVINVMEST
jgi:predicted heme/steroid binding protein